jgi:hypothetical protein
MNGERVLLCLNYLLRIRSLYGSGSVTRQQTFVQGMSSSNLVPIRVAVSIFPPLSRLPVGIVTVMTVLGGPRGIGGGPAMPGPMLGGGAPGSDMTVLHLGHRASMVPTGRSSSMRQQTQVTRI